MDPSSTNSELVFEFGPHFRAYKDGRVERFFGTDIVPPSTNPTGVSTKDVLISPETGVSARIFLPAGTDPGRKIPLLVYYHGGGFLVGSPFCAVYHDHVTSLAAVANVIVVSVNYRLAPEHPVPVFYQDSWTALQWVASHRGGGGPEPWLRDHGDFGRLFLAGDSGGANIAHNMAVQAGEEGMGGMLSGMCLVHPYFGGGDIDEIWRFVCPRAGDGADDWRANPAADARLAGMGCGRVLLCLAERDHLYDKGVWFSDTLKRSEWPGQLEVFETPCEEHVFHLFDPTCENAKVLVRRLSKFFNN